MLWLLGWIVGRSCRCVTRVSGFDAVLCWGVRFAKFSADVCSVIRSKITGWERRHPWPLFHEILSFLMLSFGDTRSNVLYSVQFTAIIFCEEWTKNFLKVMPCSLRSVSHFASRTFLILLYRTTLQRLYQALLHSTYSSANTSQRRDTDRIAGFCVNALIWGFRILIGDQVFKFTLMRNFYARVF